jgi:hypothetical protein
MVGCHFSQQLINIKKELNIFFRYEWMRNLVGFILKISQIPYC